EPVEAPPREDGEEILQAARLVPVVPIVAWLRDLDRPVDELPPLAVDVIHDRIDHEVAVLDRAHAHVAPAGEVRLHARDSAPGIDAAEAELLRGIELPAHRGVDAVAGDGEVGGGGRARCARGRRAEVQGHPALALVDAETVMIRAQRVRAEALQCRLPEDEMRAPAVDAHLGDGVAGVPAARLGIDELAEAVEEAPLAVMDPLAGRGVTEPEGGQLAQGGGKGGDAYAEPAPRGRALVHAAGEPALVQSQREGEPANAAADDRDVHVLDAA